MFTDADREQAVADLAAIEEAVQQNQEAGLSFWERIVRPDAALGRALLNLGQGQIERDEASLLAINIAANSSSAPPLASAPACWSSCSSPL